MSITVVNGAWLDIRQSADVGVDRSGEAVDVEIRICLDQTEPPTGRLQQVGDREQPPNGSAPIPFSGWLGLLRALDEALRGPQRADQ